MTELILPLLAYGALLALAGFVAAPFWRGNEQHIAYTTKLLGQFMPIPDRWVRDALRAVPAGWAGLILAGVPMFILKAQSLNVNDVARPVVSYVALGMFGVCFFLMFPAQLLIMFFNWPKFLVPPPMRREAGIAQRAVNRWRQRRARN